MLFKLTANTELDLLTKDEVASVLQSWTAELARGVKFRRTSGVGAVAANAWTIGPDGSSPIGPDVGMVWSITRIAVQGLTFGTDVWNMGIDSPTGSGHVASSINRVEKWDVGVFILNGGDRLALSGASTLAATPNVTATIGAVEVPVQLAHLLLA